MAVVQWRSGKKLDVPIVAVAGNALALKLIPSGSDKLPVAFVTTPAAIAAVTNVENRITANFATFTLNAVAVGQATLAATAGGRTIWGPFPIQIGAPLKLPDAATDAGLLTRLFLAEAPNPGTAGANASSIPEAMTLMRVVVENRLANPSARWGSAGVTNLAGVVRAPGQFAGFGSYPTLSGGVLSNINAQVALANDASDPRQPKMRAHVEQAIALASAAKPADPSSGGLFWWRTEGSGPPGTGVAIFKTLLGNTFYMEKK